MDKANAPECRRRLPELDSVHVTIGLAALYVVGFVVANVHFGYHGFVQPAFLRARYVGAAILFVALSGVPVGFGMHAMLRAGRMPERGKRSGWWNIVARRLLINFLGGAACWAVMMWITSTRPFWVWGSAAYYYAAFFAGGVVGLMVGSPFPPEPDTSQRRAAALEAGLVGLWLVLFMPAMFGGMVSANLRPDFGGGALWLADITLSDEVLPNELKRAIGFPVALVDRDDRYLSAVVCRGDGTVRRPLVRALLPLNALRSAYLVRPVASRDYFLASRDGCEGLSAELERIQRARIDRVIPFVNPSEDDLATGRLKPPSRQAPIEKTDTVRQEL